MNNNNYIFAIDNGTQSVRALIFDLEGNLLGKGKVDIEPYFSTQPGFAEQHPEYFWESLGRACEKLWNSTDIKPEQIAGVSLRKLRGTVIHLDHDRKPLRPAVIRLDQHHADVNDPLGVFGGLALKQALTDALGHRFRQKDQPNWIAQHQPDI